MATKNLVINNEYGTFTINEHGVRMLFDFLNHFLPVLNEEIDKFNSDSDSVEYDPIDRCFIPHLENDVRPVVRLIRNLLD